MIDDKKPAPEREAQARETVRIVGKVVWSINSMAADLCRAAAYVDSEVRT